jgi:hypothetical protein
MLPSLLVAAAVTAPAAPIPKDTVPNATGPAPRIVAVKADTTGAIWITANVYEKRKVQQQFMVNENGKNVLKQQEVEQTISNYIHKTISDFGGKFTTADGTALTTEEATRRVKDGATLLVTADGKPVDRLWLKAVNDDTVIMTAEGLGEAYFVHGYAPFPTTAAPRLTMLSTNDKGEVRLPVNPNSGNVNGPIYYDDFGGRRPIRGGRVMIQQNIDFTELDGVYANNHTATPAGSDGKKALTDVKFDAYDLNGKLIAREDALKRLKAGGLVVLAGDNRFPDTEYLKAFRDDLIVLVSGELVFPAGMPNPYDTLVRPNQPAPNKDKPAPQQPQAAPVQAVPAVGVAAPAVIIQKKVIVAVPAVEK